MSEAANTTDETKELPAVDPVVTESEAAAEAASTAEVAATAKAPLSGRLKLALNRVDQHVEAAVEPGAAPRPARRARLRIARIDPWSVMKTSLVFSVALAIMGFVAVWVLWMIVSLSGALDAVQGMIDSLIGNPDSGSGIQISRYADQWRVLGISALVGVANVVLLTAISTLMAFLYNLAAGVLGGLEITLAED